MQSALGGQESVVTLTELEICTFTLLQSEIKVNVNPLLIDFSRPQA